MRTKKIPTIIGITVLVIGVIAGVFLVRYQQIFKLGASGELSPKNVRISNISDTTATVSWVTDRENSGFVIFGENEGSLGNVAEDEVGSSNITHTANLKNLKPKAQYFFKINSGGKLYDNNGVAWQVKTGTTLAKPASSNLISGSIVTTSGDPAKSAIVYVSVSGNLLSTVTSQNGSWIISLSLARTGDLINYLQIDEAKTLLEISVDAGVSVASAQIYPQGARPAPSIVLGQVQDFRNLGGEGTPELPKSNVQVGEVPSPSSGFYIPQGTGSPTSKVVTLKSVNEGEVITSEKPEFFGSGPAGTTLSIKVESEAVTDSVKIPSSGDWKWSPPAVLGAGAHKITLTWKDASGITRTLVRNFIVQAAEGPAFVSTPSASPTGTPTVTPRITPTAIATAVPTLTPRITAFPSAKPAQPESGSLTPSVLLSIIGIGVIALSILIWKKAGT